MSLNICVRSTLMAFLWSVVSLGNGLL